MGQRIPSSNEQVADKGSHREDDNLTSSSTLQLGARGSGLSGTKICLWDICNDNNIDGESGDGLILLHERATCLAIFLIDLDELLTPISHLPGAGLQIRMPSTCLFHCLSSRD